MERDGFLGQYCMLKNDKKLGQNNVAMASPKLCLHVFFSMFVFLCWHYLLYEYNRIQAWQARCNMQHATLVICNMEQHLPTFFEIVVYEVSQTKRVLEI